MFCGSLRQILKAKPPPLVWWGLVTSCLRYARSRGHAGFPVIAPGPIHGGSGLRTSGKQRVHPDCPPSFRHQKSRRLPATVLLTANRPSQKPRGERGFRPPPLTHVKTRWKSNPSPLSSLHRAPAPPVSTQTREILPCSSLAGLPSSPTCGTLVSLWPLKHLGDSSWFSPRRPGSGYQPPAADLTRLLMVVAHFVTSLEGVTLRPAVYVPELPLGHSFREAHPPGGCVSRFRGVETRSSPLPVTFGLSRFGTVSKYAYRQALSGPLIVELFTVGFFGPSPDKVTCPVARVATHELPTPDDVTRTLTGDFHPDSP